MQRSCGQCSFLEGPSSFHQGHIAETCHAEVRRDNFNPEIFLLVEALYKASPMRGPDLEAPAIAIFRGGCSNVEARATVDRCHCGRLFLPVLRVILYNAQSIDPYIREAKVPGGINCISYCSRECFCGYSCAKFSEIVCTESEEFEINPAMTQCGVFDIQRELVSKNNAWQTLDGGDKSRGADLIYLVSAPWMCCTASLYP